MLVVNSGEVLMLLEIFVVVVQDSSGASRESRPSKEMT
jgi:hypothetical protein